MYIYIYVYVHIYMYTYLYVYIYISASPDADSSQDSHAMENTSILSSATDEGLEISQRLAESIFVGPDLDADGEEILTGKSE